MTSTVSGRRRARSEPFGLASRTQTVRAIARILWAIGAVVAGLAVAVLAEEPRDAQPACASLCQSLQPEGWDARVRLPQAVDHNPDPHVVEVDIDARVARVELSPGQSVEAWTYDGGVPGPIIRANVGDRLIVHFTNHLPQPSTIHWHGVRVPFAMDGVPDVSQPPVKTGESFTYDFVVPDAGLFWYHPHVMSAAQVGFGLYGALVVDDPTEAQAVGVGDELVLVLSDMALGSDGRLESPDAGGGTATMFGREGTHVLVNGREDAKMVVRAGVPQRWRIVNAAKSRFFSLDLGGATFRQIGGDGGLQEFATESDTLLVTPGERVDVIVTPRGKPGKDLTLRSVLVDRGFGTTEGRFPYNDLLTISFADLPPYSAPVLPTVRRDIALVPTEGATKVDLEFNTVQPPDADPEYVITGRLFSQKTRSIPARVGETQLWTVTNKSKWAHPLHLHGYFFQVLDDKGAPVHPVAWKDTVNIPVDHTLRLIVRFDDRPGNWMFHCHILDHADGGLMGTVDVGQHPHMHHAEH